MIAEFMGWEYFGFNDPRLEGKYRPGWKKRFNAPQIEKLKERDFLCRTHNDLKYHRSWDWLHPVLEKIAQHHYGWDKKEDEWDDTPYPRTFGMRDKEGWYMVRLNAQPLFSAPTLIEAAWQAALHFITWYQSKNKINQ